MSEIIVAGAGIGGLISAMKLAGTGHSVTLFEGRKKEDCAHEQIDAFDATAMQYAGIEIPEGYVCPPNQITYYAEDMSLKPLAVPVSETYFNITVDRKKLFNYFLSLAAEAGVKVEFETKVISPLVSGDRVCGVKTDKGDFHCDLLIDSCGIDSPIRQNLPETMMIDKVAGKYDYINSYRVTFDRRTDLPDPEHRYSIYFLSDYGFIWLITEEDYVDVLIVNMQDISSFNISDLMSKLRQRNPHMGKGKIRNGRFCRIPVRQPLAVFVANGYAAIGDAAFMTAPIKGSGISNSLIAATILTNVINEDNDNEYTVENLWKYEWQYFNETGFNACKQALVKDIIPYLTAEEINEVFSRGLMTSDDLIKIFSKNFSVPRLVLTLREKIKTINDLPVFRSQLLMLISWMGRFSILDNSLPEKYKKDDVIKWRDKYNSFFESVLDVETNTKKKEKDDKETITEEIVPE